MIWGAHQVHTPADVDCSCRNREVMLFKGSGLAEWGALCGVPKPCAGCLMCSGSCKRGLVLSVLQKKGRWWQMFKRTTAYADSAGEQPVLTALSRWVWDLGKQLPRFQGLVAGVVVRVRRWSHCRSASDDFSTGGFSVFFVLVQLNVIVLFHYFFKVGSHLTH